MFLRVRACLHGSRGPQVGEVICGRSPHLSCKRDQIKMRDYMDRQVTPPSWGTLPPRKQAPPYFIDAVNIEGLMHITLKSSLHLGLYYII